MKRYNIHGYLEGGILLTEAIEAASGKWVKYEDINHLLNFSSRLDGLEKRLSDVEKPPIPICLDCGKVLENLGGILPGAWMRSEIGKPEAGGFVCDDCHNKGIEFDRRLKEIDDRIEEIDKALDEISAGG